MLGNKNTLWTILYKSTSNIPAPDLVESFSQILQTSNDRNRRDEITGFLAFDRGKFFQVLEGSRDAVAACYARIGEDARHGQLETLLDERLTHRTFGQWSMGFADASELEDYLTLHRGLLSDQPSVVIKTMVRMGELGRAD